MIRALLFCASESSALDVQTNRVSLFHILEEVSVVAFPAFLHSVAVVAVLGRDADDQEKAKLALNIGTNAGPIASFPVEVDFVGKSRYRNMTLLQGLMLPQSTSLEFILLQKEQELARWQVPIQFIGPPVAVAPPLAQPPPTSPQSDRGKPKRKQRLKSKSSLAHKI